MNSIFNKILSLIFKSKTEETMYECAKCNAKVYIKGEVITRECNHSSEGIIANLSAHATGTAILK